MTKRVLMILVFCSAASAARAEWLSDWIEYEDHSYRMTEPMDWYQAEDLAVSVGGHLATLNDSSENAWLLSTFSALNPDVEGRLWLGLFQPGGSPEPAGGWIWTSGEPMDFMNWAPGEPNDADGGEYVGHMLGYYDPDGAPPGTWNDRKHDVPLMPGVVELIPEPSSLSLLALAGMLAWRRRPHHWRQAA